MVTGDSTSLVAGTTARCLTTSIRTVRTPEFVLFRTSAFAKDSGPSCFFRICQKTIRLVNSEDAKTIKMDFSRCCFFFQQKNQPALAEDLFFSLFAFCAFRAFDPGATRRREPLHKKSDHLVASPVSPLVPNPSFHLCGKKLAS